MNINSRDYENILPECGSPTVISIKDSNEMGIYVSLLEFDEIEGLLLFSEVYLVVKLQIMNICQSKSRIALRLARINFMNGMNTEQTKRPLQNILIELIQHQKTYI